MTTISAKTVAVFTTTLTAAAKLTAAALTTTTTIIIIRGKITHNEKERKLK